MDHKMEAGDRNAGLDEDDDAKAEKKGGGRD